MFSFKRTVEKLPLPENVFSTGYASSSIPQLSSWSQAHTWLLHQRLEPRQWGNHRFIWTKVRDNFKGPGEPGLGMLDWEWASLDSIWTTGHCYGLVELYSPKRCVLTSESVNLTLLGNRIDPPQFHNFMVKLQPFYSIEKGQCILHFTGAIPLDQCCAPAEVTILKRNKNKNPYLGYFQAVSVIYKGSWLILFWISQPPWPSSNKHTDNLFGTKVSIAMPTAFY